ncbi:MAG: hypothetical protein RLZZ69_2332 [Cyanobacteriota bacterium]
MPTKNQSTKNEILTKEQEDKQVEKQAGAASAPDRIYKESKISIEHLIIEKKKIKTEEKAIENEAFEVCEKEFAPSLSRY